VIIADTSGLLAFYNSREPAHEAVRSVVQSTDDVLVVSPFVLAELDYLAATRLGTHAELAILTEIAGGAYELAALDADDIGECARLIGRYDELGIGLADASLAVLARRFGTRTILTLDRRHFDVVRPLDGGRFRILPA
jgi:predicted nucleic acid-binding protein